MAKEQSQGLALRRKLERLQLELSSIQLGILPEQGINGNWGVPRYGVGEELHDQKQADDAVFDKGDYSVFNFTVEEPVIDMKHPAGESEAEKPFMSQFMRNLSGPNSSGIHHGEGCSNNASDISKAKGFGTYTGDEKDFENKSARTSFVQED